MFTLSLISGFPFALLKSSRVAALLAERLGGVSSFEAFCNSPSSLRGEYLGYILLKSISERYFSVGIKAARYDTAVRKYAEVVAKSVTEYVIAHIFRILIGPGESVAPLEMELIADSRAAL